MFDISLYVEKILYSSFDFAFYKSIMNIFKVVV